MRFLKLSAMKIATSSEPAPDGLPRIMATPAGSSKPISDNGASGEIPVAKVVRLSVSVSKTRMDGTPRSVISNRGASPRFARVAICTSLGNAKPVAMLPRPSLTILLAPDTVRTAATVRSTALNRSLSTT